MGGASMEGAGPTEERNMPESAFCPDGSFTLTNLRLPGRPAARQHLCWLRGRGGSVGGAHEAPQGTDLEHNRTRSEVPLLVCANGY